MINALSQHIIRQQKVEILSEDGEKTQDIFTEVSRLFNNRVKDITGYLLDKHSSNDILIRLHTLELDLGVVSFPFSEESFIKIYSERLEEALVANIKKQKEQLQTPEADTENTPLTPIHLLEQYLLTGTIAWWATSNDLKNPVSVFKKSHEKEVVALQMMIKRIFPQAQVRKRLVYAFEDETIRAVIRFIQPTEERFISDYHTEVSEVQQKSTVVKLENTAFRKRLWLFILDYLAYAEGSHFNRKQFTKATIKAIADNFNLSFEQTLFYFSEGIKAIPAQIRKVENLVSIVEELTLESLKETDTILALQAIQTYKGRNNTLLLNNYPAFFFLVNGFLPHKSSLSSELPKNDLLAREFQLNPAYTRSFLANYGKLPQLRQRLVTHFDDSVILQVVKSVEPANAETILFYVDYTTSLQRKTNFIRTEETRFRKSIWEFILAYLFLEAGSVFNAKMFLVTNIRTLAAHYSIDYVKLLAMLVQGIGQQPAMVSDQSDLFYLLTELLAEAKKSNTSQLLSTFPVSEKRTTAAITDEEQDSVVSVSLLSQLMQQSEKLAEPIQQAFVHNLVLHVLAHGELPWWITEEHYTLENIFKQLKRKYANEFKKALIYAVKKEKISLRFILQNTQFFSKDLLDVFSNKQQYETLLAFVKKITDATGAMGSADVLFTKALLAALNEGTNETPRLIAFFETVFRQYELLHGKENTTKWLASNQPLMQTYSQAIQEAYLQAANKGTFMVFAKQLTYSEANVEALLFYLLNNTVSLIPKELLNTLTLWLIQFAKSGKLPANAIRVTVLSEKELVAWMLVYLFRKQKDRLANLLARDTLTLPEQLLLMRIANESGIASDVQQFLETNIQKNLFDRTEKSLSSTDPDYWKQVITDLQSDAPNNKHLTHWQSLLMFPQTRSMAAFYLSEAHMGLLIEKLQQPRLWKAYKIFNEAFVENTTDHFEREQYRKWVTEFFLTLLGSNVTHESNLVALAKQWRIFLQSKSLSVHQSIISKLATRTLENVSLSGNAKELVMIFQTDYTQFLKHEDHLKQLETEIHQADETLAVFLENPNKSEIDEAVQELLADKTPGKKKKNLPFGEQVYIKNAGMVLLHPFMSTLFSRAELMRAGTFLSEASQTKAIQLLQYAVVGTEVLEEQDCLLNKILVGMSPEDVIIDVETLNAAENELVTGMLGAIIQQWDKLKNTSLEGFRNSFLIRDGYVFQTDEAWVLRVEQRGYDILLQTLPWSFGMIKFSWMKKPLIVEWT